MGLQPLSFKDGRFSPDRHEPLFSPSSLGVVDMKGFYRGTVWLILNVQGIPLESVNGTSLHCETCNAALGSSRGDEDNLRLYKSRLALVTSQDQRPQEFPPSVFICSQLLSLIENTVSRKIVLHSETQGEIENRREGLLLWIFNPDIYYSSSNRGPTVHRAMKVFYQPLLEIGKFLDEHSNTHEELVVPPEDLEDFRKTLHDSTAILPQSARSFQDWAIGLIDRWEKNATGASWMDQNPLNKKMDPGFETFKLPEGMQELYL